MPNKLSHTTWNTTVSIPSYVLGLYLTDEEYEQVQEEMGAGVKVKLTFDYSPADWEVGLPESFEYADWDWANKTYSDTIRKAVDQYLSEEDADVLYGKKAQMEFSNYHNSL